MNNQGAWHNSKEEKDWMVKEAQEHEEADRYQAGRFGEMDELEDFKGCSVGCSIRSINYKHDSDIDTDSHSELADYIGLSEHEWLIRLQDTIFEGLDGDNQRFWTERFFTAIQVGSDISLVLPRFLSFVLNDTLVSVQKGDNQKQEDAIQAVITLMDEWRKTGVKPSRERLDAAASYAASYAAAASYDAASYASYAASYAADAAAADADAAAYAYVAAYAADADAADAASYAAVAAYAADADATRVIKWRLYANKLIELLTDCGE